MHSFEYIREELENFSDQEITDIMPQYVSVDAASKEQNISNILEKQKTLYPEKTRLIEVPKTIISKRKYKAVSSGGTSISFNEEKENILNMLNQDEELQLFLRQQNIRRGDVVHIAVIGSYRNEGKYIYDGKKLVDLEYRGDEYGSVPSNFHVIEEFPIHYWTDIIVHNHIVWFNIQPYIPEIMENLVKKDLDDDEFDIYESSFTYKGEKYNMVFMYMNIDDDPRLPQGIGRVETDLKTDMFEAHNEEYEDFMGTYDRKNTLFNSQYNIGYLQELAGKPSIITVHELHEIS